MGLSGLGHGIAGAAGVLLLCGFGGVGWAAVSHADPADRGRVPAATSQPCQQEKTHARAALRARDRAADNVQDDRAAIADDQNHIDHAKNPQERKHYRAKKARDQQALAADQQTLATRQQRYEQARDAYLTCLRSASASVSGGATTTTTVTANPTSTSTVTQTTTTTASNTATATQTLPVPVTETATTTATQTTTATATATATATQTTTATQTATVTATATQTVTVAPTPAHLIPGQITASRDGSTLVVQADITNTGTQDGTIDPNSFVEVVSDGSGNYSQSTEDFTAPFTASTDMVAYENLVYRAFTGSVPGGATVTVTVAFQLSPAASGGQAIIGLGSAPYYADSEATTNYS